MSVELKEIIAKSPVLVERYRLGKILGKGNMGAVIEGWDIISGRSVAVKILLSPENSALDIGDTIKRLRDEARAAMRVKSPHIVEIVDTGDDPNFGPFVVYQLLTGKTLRDELDATGGLGWPRTKAGVVTPLLSGLQALHRAGIVHRDVKPENLLLSRGGEYKVGDLGLAVFEAREAKTMTGCLVGTPGYMAPEVLLTPDKSVTPAADIYGAGILIIEAVTGRLPFKGSGPLELITSQLETGGGVKFLESMRLPPGLKPVLKKAVTSKPSERYREAADFLKALEGVGTDETVHARITKELKAPLRTASRAYGTLLRVIIYCLVCLLVSLGLYGRLHRRKQMGELADRNIRIRSETAGKLADLVARAPGKDAPVADLLEYRRHLEDEYNKSRKALSDLRRTAALWCSIVERGLKDKGIACDFSRLIACRMHKGGKGISGMLQELRLKLIRSIGDRVVRPDRCLILAEWVIQQWDRSSDDDPDMVIARIARERSLFNRLPLDLRVGPWQNAYRFSLYVYTAKALKHGGFTRSLEMMSPGLRVLARRLEMPPEAEILRKRAKTLAGSAGHLDEYSFAALESLARSSYRDFKEWKMKIKNRTMFKKLTRQYRQDYFSLKGACMSSYWAFSALSVVEPLSPGQRLAALKSVNVFVDLINEFPEKLGESTSFYMVTAAGKKRLRLQALGILHDLVRQRLRGRLQGAGGGRMDDIIASACKVVEGWSSGTSEVVCNEYAELQKRISAFDPPFAPESSRNRKALENGLLKRKSDL